MRPGRTAGAALAATVSLGLVVGWSNATSPAAASAVGASAVAGSGGASRDASAAQAPASGQSLAEAVADAAADSGVPADLLAAWAWTWTRGEGHGAAPSMAGGFGPFHLTDVAALREAKGEPGATAPGEDTLAQAAELTGHSRDALRSDTGANAAGIAAVLAERARALGDGDLPADLAGWAPALADVAGGGEGGDRIAAAVLDTLREGASRTTADGDRLAVAAHPTLPPTALERGAGRPRDDDLECPATLDCEWIPAAYKLNSATNMADYGNYDYADRPTDLPIRYIVIHDTEVSYDGTIGIFQNPRRYVAAHYVVRSGDGHVAQMMRAKDVGWHAGSWYVNMHSIGIENEGYAELGGTWFTEPMYRSNAALISYLAHRFRIPLDRQHVIGHDDAQALTQSRVAGMHWDPGPYWDWSHLMDLAGAPLRAHGGPRAELVTVAPDFAGNQQVFASCSGSGRALPRQSSSAVPLRQAPSHSAPLVNDPALRPGGTAGTDRACDWGSKAATGQQFAVAERRGEWTALWYAGQKAWVHDPASEVLLPARGRLASPRPGLESVPVYGKAYPEASAYPSTIPVQDLSPLAYRLGAGQSYVVGDVLVPDYYFAKTYDDSRADDHTVVRGQETYVQVQVGHRLGYVKAADVVVRPATG